MALQDELKLLAQQVRNATQVGENTAERVGHALENAADLIADQAEQLATLETRTSEVVAEIDGKVNRSGDKMGGDLEFNPDDGIGFDHGDGSRSFMYAESGQKFPCVETANYERFDFHKEQEATQGSTAIATSGDLWKSEQKKQDKLVSGVNIKTINGEPLLGGGNITIQGGGTTDAYTKAESNARFAKLSDVNQNIQAGVIGANQSLSTPFINLGGADLETVDGKLQVDGENVAMVRDIPSGDGYFELLAHVVSDSTKGKVVELIPSCKGYKEIVIRREAPTAISQNVYVDMGVYPNSVHFSLSTLNSTRRFIWHIKLDPTITITEQYKYNYQDALRCDTSVGVCTAFGIEDFDLPLSVEFYNTTAQPDGEEYYVYGKK